MEAVTATMTNVANPVELAGAAVFLLTYVGLMAWASRSEMEFGEFSVGLRYRDIFVFLIALVPLLSAFAHLLMGFGHGFLITLDGRQVSFLRYFEWGISTALLVFGIGILTQRKHILLGLVSTDLLMIFAGFMAAVETGPIRYLYVAISTGAFLVLLYIMLVQGERAMQHRPPSIQRLFRQLRLLTVVVWSLFPIIWMLSVEGFAVLTFSQSQVAFLALDLLAKVGYAVIVLYSLGQLDVSTVDQAPI